MEVTPLACPNSEQWETGDNGGELPVLPASQHHALSIARFSGAPLQRSSVWGCILNMVWASENGRGDPILKVAAPVNMNCQKKHEKTLRHKDEAL